MALIVNSPSGGGRITIGGSSGGSGSGPVSIGGTGRVVIGGRTVDTTGRSQALSGAAQRTMAQKVALLRHLKKQADQNKGSWFERAIRSNAGAAVNILASLPNAAVQAIKLPTSGVIGAYGQIDRLVDVPLGDQARNYSYRYANELKDAGTGMAENFVYRWKPIVTGDWDEAKRQFIDEGALVSNALDVALLGRGGGTAAGAARRGAARVAKSRVEAGSASPLAKYLSETKHFTRDPSAEIRQRGTRTYKQKGVDAEGNDVVLKEVERNLGLYSSNPVVRGPQRLRTAAANALQERISSAADGGSGLAKTFEERQFNMRAAREQRKTDRQIEAAAARDVTEITRGAKRALGKLRKSTVGTGAGTRMAPYEQLSAFLHAKGVLQKMTPDEDMVAVRDRLADFWEDGVAAERARGIPEAQLKNRVQMIETLRTMPKSLLDLETSPSRVREAVTAIENMGESVTGIRVSMVPEERRAALAQGLEDARYRHAGMAHAGVEFDPNKPKASLEALKTERDAARAEMDSLLQRKTTAPERTALEQGKTADRTQLKIKRREIRNEINKTRSMVRTARKNKDEAAVARHEARLSTLQDRLERIPSGAAKGADDIAMARQVVSELEAAAADGSKTARSALISLQKALASHRRNRTANSLGKVRSASTRGRKALDNASVKDLDNELKRLRGRALMAEGRNVDDPAMLARLERQLGRKQGQRVGSYQEIISSARKLQEAQRRYASAKRSGAYVGDWTERGPAWPGQKPGTYMADRPVDRIPELRGKRLQWSARDRDGIFQGLGPKQMHASQGTLWRTANIVTDPRMAIFSAEEAIKAAYRPEFVTRFVDGAALRGAGGKLLTGDEAYRAARANPDKLVLVNRELLAKTFEQADAMLDGQTLGNSELERMFRKADGGNNGLLEEVMSNPKGWVAVSKPFYDEALGMMRDPRGGMLKAYDSGLSAWKSGMLVFAPRWYIYNFLGNSFLYGTLAGFDIRSLRQAWRSMKDGGEKLDDLIPEDFKHVGLTDEIRSAQSKLAPGEAQGALKRFTESAFAFNSNLEQVWRRAAYLNRIKRQARDAGMKRAWKGQTADERLIEALDNLPLAAKEEALTESLRFMGDYKNMTRFEQNVARRIFPFYSFLRVISRLTFSMPFKHPARLAAMSYLSQMGTDMEDPLNDLRAYYERGAINLPGGYTIRTGGMNPYQTTLGAVNAALVNNNAGEFINELAGMTNPVFQAIASQATGTDIFTGRQYTAPAGWNGSVQAYGRPMLTIDGEGNPVEMTPRPSFLESVLRSTPIVNQIRPTISDASGNSPFPTTSTLDLIKYALGGGKSPDQLFYPPSDSGKPTNRGWYTAPGGFFLGAPVVQRDDEALVNRLIKKWQDYEDAQKQTAKTQARNQEKFNR